MKNIFRSIPYLMILFFAGTTLATDSSSVVLIDDDFERNEEDEKVEQVGNGWSTNSKSRAKGEKQVDLKDGAMFIKRAAVADHGVSVVHEIGFRDGTVELRFKLGAKDDLGINIADMKEKSVHAGHICMAKIKPKTVEIVDLKTGRMDLATRKRRLADSLTDEDNKRIKAKSKYFKTNFATDQWHSLKVQIEGETMSVFVDSKKVGSFSSPGIGHPTKGRLRLAVGKSAWVDDVKVTKTK